MATKSRSTQPVRPEPAKLLIPHAEARERLTARLEAGKPLLTREIRSTPELEDAKREYDRWSSFNIEFLKRNFSSTEYADEYSGWGSVAFVPVGPRSPGKEVADYRETVQTELHRLESLIERLELIPMAGSAAPPARPAEPATKSRKVFVVHGHDDAAKANLEILLREFGLEPIVLHRQADEGQTVIEKFEKHSDVAYAFILLTPDEVAYLRKEDALPDDERKSKQLRARPNVIFEFGYFVGKLGRKNVCCLHTGGVELPSDVGGMVYKKFSDSVDEAGVSIQRDLRAARLID